MSQSTSYSLGGAGAGYGAIPSISIGDIYSTKSLPNRKFSMNIHTAHGGYIVEISNNSSYGDLHIISEDKDLGTEIGKIITHYALTKEHE